MKSCVCAHVLYICGYVMKGMQTVVHMYVLPMHLLIHRMSMHTMLRTGFSVAMVGAGFMAGLRETLFLVFGCLLQWNVVIPLSSVYMDHLQHAPPPSSSLFSSSAETYSFFLYDIYGRYFAMGALFVGGIGLCATLLHSTVGWKQMMQSCAGGGGEAQRREDSWPHFLSVLNSGLRNSRADFMWMVGGMMMMIRTWWRRVVGRSPTKAEGNNDHQYKTRRVDDSPPIVVAEEDREDAELREFLCYVHSMKDINNSLVMFIIVCYIPIVVICYVIFTDYILYSLLFTLITIVMGFAFAIAAAYTVLHRLLLLLMMYYCMIFDC